MSERVVELNIKLTYNYNDNLLKDETKHDIEYGIQKYLHDLVIDKFPKYMSGRKMFGYGYSDTKVMED